MSTILLFWLFQIVNLVDVNSKDQEFAFFSNLFYQSILQQRGTAAEKFKFEIEIQIEP